MSRPRRNVSDPVGELIERQDAEDYLASLLKPVIDEVLYGHGGVANQLRADLAKRAGSQVPNEMTINIDHEGVARFRAEALINFLNQMGNRAMWIDLLGVEAVDELVRNPRSGSGAGLKPRPLNVTGQEFARALVRRFNEVVGAGHACRCCYEPMVPNTTGRPRQFCSAKCRKAFSRRPRFKSVTDPDQNRDRDQARDTA